MRMIRWYILRESFYPFVMALGTLTCVFLLGHLIKLTNLVINKGVSLSTVGNVFILTIPVLLGHTIPFACLFAVILSFSRLSADNEILAMRASGIHLMKLLYPFVFVGLIISLLCIILNERIIPYSHHKQRLLIKSLGAENPTALLEAGIFIKAFDGQILFIHKISGNKLYNVTIYQPQENGPTRTIVAKRGEFTPIPGTTSVKLKLIDGTADEPNLENPDSFYKLNFQTYFMTLDLSKDTENIKKKPKSMSFKELWEEIEQLESIFVDTGKHRTEFAKKITWSFSALFFILLGFPLAVITNRREKSANVSMAVMCAVIYYVLSLGCETISAKGFLSPWIIMWIPNALAAVAAAILIYKCVS